METATTVVKMSRNLVYGVLSVSFSFPAILQPIILRDVLDTEYPLLIFMEGRNDDVAPTGG
jgi:hypothetical protein